MFNFRQFDNAIFDMNKVIYSILQTYAGNRAEELEKTTGRPIFNCTKMTMKTEVENLNALLPTTNVTLLANMTNAPSDYRNYLVDKLQGVK